MPCVAKVVQQAIISIVARKSLTKGQNPTCMARQHILLGGKRGHFVDLYSNSVRFTDSPRMSTRSWGTPVTRPASFQQTSKVFLLVLSFFRHLVAREQKIRVPQLPEANVPTSIELLIS